jgi:hypothetical protein
MIMKQSTINQAKQLGFKVTDRLEQYVSDYNLKTNEDTFEETERWTTKKHYLWNVIFPPDYPNQSPHAVYDDADLLSLINQYNKRFDNAKHDAEITQSTIKAMEQFKQRFTDTK